MAMAMVMSLSVNGRSVAFITCLALPKAVEVPYLPAACLPYFAQ